IPIKLSDFPIFNHYLALLSVAVTQNVREFIRKFINHFKQIFIFLSKQITASLLFQFFKFFLIPFSFYLLNGEIINFSWFEYSKRSHNFLILCLQNQFFNIGINLVF